MVSKKSLLVFAALFLLLAGYPAGRLLRAQEQPTEKQYQMVSAKPGEFCTVCGVRLTEDDVALIVKGRRVPLNSMMVEEFLSHQEKYFAKMEPRGALFQESFDAPTGTSLGGVSYGWFLVGLYILVALLFAGLSGYAAVSRGLQPVPHFLTGLFFSAFGFLYVLTRPRKLAAHEIPSGLRKVPITSKPVACASCGHPNHPSATKCAECGAKLQPVMRSEASRVLHTSVN